MMNYRLRGAILAVCAAAGLLAVLSADDAQAQKNKAGPPPKELKWIWFDEGDPLSGAPAETRYFRKTFEVPRGADEAALDITADNEFTVWINGTQVGKGDEWHRVWSFDVKKHIADGKNAIAVEAHNTGGPAGLLVRLSFVPTGGARRSLVSDQTWKASKSPAPAWFKAMFDDSKWTDAKALCAYGSGPWQGLRWDADGGAVNAAKPGRFVVPEGFKVEEAVKNPYSAPDAPRKPFSLVNICFDAKGRLLVSEEGGPILLCDKPDKDGILQEVRPYCELVKNCHGMCWVDDALYLVGNGPKGTGLYRCRDTKQADKIDEATLIHAFNGGMGEHGPHAVIHGPDDKLYLVIGNHAWAKVDGQQTKLADNSPLKRWPTGGMGPDQGKPGTTEDVLLPRQNDANGHAANILAPGGTIWRLDKDGKNMALFSAGYRNEFDAAFSPTGELFTFDSDMEWDENLPWYRPVRICHATPGSDFVWRTGAANTPDYYADSLPAVHNTGRGSPVGVEFYDHFQFPEKYRRCCFMCDWSLGIIYAVFLKPDGASYKAEVEKFCTGNPLNVTDCAVAPDGSLVFTTGGRGSQGGVYRISYQPDSNERRPGLNPWAQPLAAYSRALWAKIIDKEIGREQARKNMTKDALASGYAVPLRLLALTMLQLMNLGPDDKLLVTLAQDKEPEVRAQAVYFLGVHGYKDGHDALIKALKDADKVVQRRACEALIRAGFEPPVDALWPLFKDEDRFLRTAARLVLQRIDSKKWADKVWAEKDDRVAWEGIIALCKTGQAAEYSDAIFKRLREGSCTCDEVPEILAWMRTVQLAFVHTGNKGKDAKATVVRCTKFFPASDKFVNRELVIILTHARKEGIIDTPVHADLLAALKAADGDRPQQIHYFYCLRLLHNGWTPEQKEALLTWFNSTQGWTGGASYTRFLDNILRDLDPIFAAEDRKNVLAKADQMPRSAAALFRTATPEQLPPLATLVEAYEKLARAKPSPVINDLKGTIVAAVGLREGLDAQAALRKIGDSDPGQAEAVARALVRSPTEQNWPYLVRGLSSPNKAIVMELTEALKKAPTKPKMEDATPFHTVLEAASRFDANDRNRWKLIELLRHWGVRDFGAEPLDSKTELMSLARWFGQAFPKEKPLPGVLSGKPAESKYKFDELLAYLEKDPEGKKGDPARGRVVFEKATCIKCHKYGKEGEGIGPDLTTVSKRFKRDYILESILDPSKVISDQYRSSTIITKKGVSLTGLAAPQGDTVTLLQSDGSKVMLKKDEVEQQVASLVSVMPEKLLDPLTRQEIADLFAYLESEPK